MLALSKKKSTLRTQKYQWIAQGISGMALNAYWDGEEGAYWDGEEGAITYIKLFAVDIYSNYT